MEHLLRSTGLLVVMLFVAYIFIRGLLGVIYDWAGFALRLCIFWNRLDEAEEKADDEKDD